MYFQGLCVCSYRMPQSLGGAGRLEGEKFSISESSIGYIINPSGTEAGVSLWDIPVLSFLPHPHLLSHTSAGYLCKQQLCQPSLGTGISNCCSPKGREGNEAHT